MVNISQNVNIEMLEKLPDGTYKLKYPKTKASQVKLEDTEDNFVATEVEGAMNELFTNVSDGKDLVGGAITDVDDSVVIPTDPTFNDLASAIGGISTGKKWASGTATVNANVTNSYPSINGGGVSSMRHLEVTGLDFEPSSVVMIFPRAGKVTWLTVYTTSAPAYPKLSLSARFSPTGSTTEPSHALKADVSPAYVDSSGFHIPSAFAGECHWIAYE